MTGFDALLHLQEVDTTIDQLRHRFDHLPERAEVEANVKALARLDDDLAAVQAERDVIARDQKRIEDEVATVEAKAKDVHEKLYSGTVKAHKELIALQEDYDSLKRRQATLEDQVIEQMEAAEPVDARLSVLRAERAALDEAGQKLTIALADAEGFVEGELADAQQQREAAAIEVPEDLRVEYERVRPQFGGIAVAKLVGSQCHGCHLTLSAVAMDRIRKLPPEALVTCEECGRILVH